MRRDSVSEPLTFGSSWLSAIQRVAVGGGGVLLGQQHAEVVLERAVIASTMVSVIGSAVAVPDGTPPANGLVRGM